MATDSTDSTNDKRGAGAAEIDTTVAHTARIWNYWLGGKDNYPIDRQVGTWEVGTAASITSSTG